MIFENLFNLPYLFLLVPLIFSAFSILQNYEVTDIIFAISVITFIILLSFFLIPSTLNHGILQSRLNRDISFIMGEYKIDFIKLIFLICIFFTKLISFMFFDKSDFNTEKNKFSFSSYLINYFAICGIFISNNIFNIFIYLNIYSFTLYNIISDYKNKEYKKIAYKYYINGSFGLMLFLFFIFIVFLKFGSPDIDFIKNNIGIIRNDYVYNSLIILLLFIICLRFFSFNSYLPTALKMTETSNTLFINIFFSDVIIGIYILWTFLHSLFDFHIIFYVFYLKYFFYILGSVIIIYNSYQIYVRKNLFANLYNFLLISLGYISILISLNNNYGFVSMILFIINYTLINFLLYVICALFFYLYRKTDLAILKTFCNYDIIIYSIFFSKLCFPIAFGFSANWTFLLSVIEKESYFLLIPFIIEKSAIIVLLARCYLIFCEKKESKEYIYFDIANGITLKTNFIIMIIIIFILIVGISFFEFDITNALLKYINFK
jgi:multicomponent Na+:H+ antiporter subunit D